MRTYLLTICFYIFFYSTQPVLSADNKNNITLPEDIHSAANEILRELFDKPIEKAKEVVRQNTGIDFEKRGYNTKRKHTILPPKASDETRRELSQLKSEHDHNVFKLEQELEKKIIEARREFEREAMQEDKAEKLFEKKEKYRKKVEEAYVKFDKKITEENIRFDEKREKIIERVK